MTPYRLFILVGAAAVGLGYAALDWTIDRLTR